MTFRKHIILTVLSFSFIGGFGQTFDFVKVMAGKGIVFNNDTILLNTTSLNETRKILKIKANSNEDGILMQALWDGYDIETQEMTSGSEWLKEVRFKNIVFEFASENDSENLKLRRIRIGEDKSMKIYTDNGFEIGEINPNISELFPRISKHDIISDDLKTYNLYSYGVSFGLEKLETNDLRLVEISTHYKIGNENGL